MVAVVLFRNDLRLVDHLALNAAIRTGDYVLPIYVYDQSCSRLIGGASKWWLHHSLLALQRSLKSCDANIILRRGNSLEILKDLLGKINFTHIFWHDRYDQEGRKQDEEIRQYFENRGVECESFSGLLMFQSENFRTKEKTPFKVFSPFWKHCLRNGDVITLSKRPSKIKYYSGIKIHSETLSSWKLLPTKPHWARRFGKTWIPGEQGAQKLFKEFLNNKLSRYKIELDKPAALAISDLSPHIHWGEISVRQLWHDVKAHSILKNCSSSSECFLKALGWREFSYYTLYHYPKIATQPLKEKFQNFHWNEEMSLFQAWSQGNTGYPIVDAGMRQLWQTGYMHNRVRLITASFLIKNLLISWQEGEEWFWDTLVDADLASNSFNWQWVAGCGADAAPYFRIFNPILQSRRFDSQGKYIRYWVPELAEVSNKYIHQPWRMKKRINNYPSPIVDFYSSRDEAMDRFRQLPTINESNTSSGKIKNNADASESNKRKADSNSNSKR